MSDLTDFNGVLNVNKPIGMSSHDVVYGVRRATGVKRVGHAGTLDPLASGVLIVLVGREYTKQQSVYMDADKEYEAEITFGSVSETYDAEGPIKQQATNEQVQVLTEAGVAAALPQFTGTIQQKPPAHSAIKVGGKRLYKEARKGTLDESIIPMRTVTIDTIELLNFTPATEGTSPKARIRVHCQKGVYIRSLANDIGEVLGIGGYLSALVRTRIGTFTISDSIDYEDIHQDR